MSNHEEHFKSIIKGMREYSGKINVELSSVKRTLRDLLEENERNRKKAISALRLSIVCDLPKELFQKYIDEGMPSDDISKVITWVEVMKESFKDLPTEEKSAFLNLNISSFKTYEKHGMPIDSIDKAEKWIEVNTYLQKGIRHIHTGESKIFQSLKISSRKFQSYKKHGMPIDSLINAKRWIKKNTQRKGKLRVLCSIDNFDQMTIKEKSKLLNMTEKKYFMLKKKGMPTDSSIKANEWLESN